MFCIKGSKHLFLCDYNANYDLPVWINSKERAITFEKMTEAVAVRDFLNHLGCECKVSLLSSE